MPEGGGVLVMMSNKEVGAHAALDLAKMELAESLRTVTASSFSVLDSIRMRPAEGQLYQPSRQGVQT